MFRTAEAAQAQIDKYASRRDTFEYKIQKAGFYFEETIPIEDARG